MKKSGAATSWRYLFARNSATRKPDTDLAALSFFVKLGIWVRWTGHPKIGLWAPSRRKISSMAFPSINPALDRALAARKYETPTAVQIAVLEERARNRDLLVSAQTGSGKTIAFGLSMAMTILGQEERFGPAAEPLALIIAPTRELAMQVQRELAWLYAETGARLVTCVGGMDARMEARQLGFGAHIVVGTPGRLRDHIERHRLDLGKLKSIVLDEADEMLDLGFREDLEFILDKTPPERQMLLFSATMPQDIEAMAKRYQREALRIETIRRNEQHADIEYRAIRVAPSDVENAVVNVLRFYEPRAALVFCSTRESVKRMHARLVERGFAAVALSGELSQSERSHALVAVRDGRARVLVATDVAARGLDLPDLALVIHGELPHDRETLLHRSGRTGRAGRKGMCVLVVPFNRRRKAEALLGAARLQVKWAPAPTVDEIRAKDQERFLSNPIFTEIPTDIETALAKALQDGRSAEEIALALVRLHRARLPEPEDLAEDTGPPRREDRERRPDRDHRQGRGPEVQERRWQRQGHAPEREGQRSQEHRETSRPRRTEGREMVWFRLNIGRARNADPRWILPLICTAGGVSKAEIGAIKISERETRFEIAADHAEQFEELVRTSKNKQGQISRVASYTSADDAAVAAAIDALPPPSLKSSDTSDRRPRPRKPWQDRDRAKAHAPKSSAAESHPKAGAGDERPRKGPDAKYLRKQAHRRPQHQ